MILEIHAPAWFGRVAHGGQLTYEHLAFTPPTISANMSTCPNIIWRAKQGAHPHGNEYSQAPFGELIRLTRHLCKRVFSGPEWFKAIAEDTERCYSPSMLARPQLPVYSAYLNTTGGLLPMTPNEPHSTATTTATTSPLQITLREFWRYGDN